MISTELKEFQEFKHNYKFIQKDLVEENGSIYCDGILLKDSERK